MSETAANYKSKDYLAPYEQAARIYCEKAGLDPDLLIPRPHPVVVGMMESFPQWRFVAEDLIDLSMKLTALREAATKPVIAVMKGH